MASPLDRLRPGNIPPPTSSRPGVRGQIDPRVQQAVTLVAGRYNVDPTLAIALLRQENAAQNPGLVGTSGEVGLFQILPTTALMYAQVPGNTPQERIANMTEKLKDPNFNTQIAMQHVSRLSRMFQNDPEKVFAAYNAGPTTVARAEADAQARGIPWQQSVQENRAARGVNPGQVSGYVSSATGLLNEGGGPGAPVSSTGVQRDILRTVPPEGPTVNVAPGIPTPVGANPPAAPVPAVVPPPPTRPQPPMGPPTPPERTPVSPALPPVGYGSLPGDFISQERGGAPPPGVPRERTPVTPRMIETPTGPQPDETPQRGASSSWAMGAPPGQTGPWYRGDAPRPPQPDIPVLDTDPMSGAPIPKAGPTTGVSSDFGPQESPPILDRDIVSGAPLPGPGPSRGVTSDFSPPAPVLDRDPMSGMPMPGPSRGASSEWEPSLATVPPDVKTPGLPPVPPQADMNAALGSLTDEELLDLAQWLEQQGAGAPAGMPAWPQPYHQNIMGGLPTFRPQRPGFAEEALYPWEGGR